MSIELIVAFKEEEGITREFHIYYNSKAYMLQPSWNSRITNGDASDGLIKKGYTMFRTIAMQRRKNKSNVEI